ncbi:MAG: hypothetical protein KOO62_07060 [candidate division Zixibacteria bacterium]|nr:hypothetical protein [candidate division Zixibacteria bacterium]
MNGWHLEYDIDVDEENGVVYEKIYGIFRPDTTLAYLRDFEEKVTPIIEKPWVELTDLLKWKTCHPECIRMIGDHLRWCREHNMKWSVNIIDNTVTYGQLKRMIAIGGTRSISKMYRNHKDGALFLREQGFTVGEFLGGR